MAQTMGFGVLAEVQTVFKRKNRWLFKIDDVSDDGASALPPLKSARPSLTFKEMEAQHLTETIYFPSKPEWKPIQLTLYDIKVDGTDRGSKVFDWIKKIYDPKIDTGNWKASCDGTFKKRCTLEMYDGCGMLCEKWTFENAWPQVIEWGDLDMADSSVLTIDITLRYDRAYRED